jgi:DNA-binding NarL/FixJ family response regulator
MTSTDSVALSQQWARPLTRRESEIVLLVGSGISNKEIAEQLGLSVGTIKIHMHSIFQKTGARRRYDVIAQVAREAAARNL